jgi:hypothetical protein
MKQIAPSQSGLFILYKLCLIFVLTLSSVIISGCAGSSGGSTTTDNTGTGTDTEDPVTPPSADSYQGINQIYISPTGDDSNNCTTTDTPCKTFEQAISLMSDGDGLVLKDGLYTLAENGTLDRFTNNGDSIALSGMAPSGISANQPTVITVEHLNAVHVEGGLRIGLTGTKIQNVIIYGITFHDRGTIYNGDYITVKNCGFEGGFSFGTIDHDQGATYNLMEDVWVWGKEARHTVTVYRSHHNTLRRVIVRPDGCAEDWCGEGNGNYSAGITVYNSHDNILENVIVLDRSLASNSYGYADFSTAQHDSSRPEQPEGEALGRNSWLGCMSINSVDSAMVFEADEVTSGTTATIRDFVALNSTGGGMSLDGSHRPYEGNSFFDVDGVHLYPISGGSLFIGCDTVNGSDPGCAHSLENVNEGEYTAGLAEKTVPQKRYVDGSLTTDDLWEWPYEARIKSEICVVDGAAISRGICGTTQTISNYINSF